MDRFTSRAITTVYFLDDDHLLLTFNAKKLMRRLPECPPTHHDRIIHAAVLELSSGRLVTEKDWYVHDYGPYLWTLSPGRLLLRRLNSLYEVDSGLHEKLLRDFDSPLLWIAVTPDAKEIIVETGIGNAEEPGKTPAVGAPARARVKIHFLNAGTLAEEHSLQATGEVELPATSFGYADFTHSPSRKLWLVRFGPSAERRGNIARVRSRCAPDLAFPTSKTLFIGRCSAGSQAYSVSVFTLSGHPLWRQQWPQLNHFPQLERSADGSRFAVGTVTASADARLPAVPNVDDPAWPSVEEDIRIFETATGKPVLSTVAGNVILNNPTFSLSPDGRSFALLDGTLLKLYDLPTQPNEERAKYVALNANAPTLLAPAPPANSASDEVSLDDPEESQPPDQGDADLAAALGITKKSVPEPPAAGSEAGARSGPTGSRQGELPTATIRAGTQEVLVDVVVTDGKGNPIKNLPKEDFEIQEDGKPQSLSSFSEFDALAPQAPAGAPIVSNPVPNVFTNKTPPHSSRPLTLVMLDLVNTPFTDQQYARQELVKFLKKKPRDMQFAIFVLGARLTMIQGFTADENILLASVTSKKAGVRFSSDIQPDASGLNDVIRETKINAQFNFATQFAVQQLQQLQYVDMAAQLDRRMARTVDAFNQLAAYLSAMPGRKNLVWLSGSFPAGFLASDSLNADTPAPATTIRKYDDEIRKATNALAKSNIAVYPVDVRGLSTEPGFDSSESGTAATSVGPAGSQTPGPPGRSSGSPVTALNTTMAIQAPSPLMQEVERANNARAAEEGTMDQIAEGTGGKAFYNTNGIQQAIETAVEQGSQYYLLSYSPRNRNYDGRFRRLKIRLAHKGYHLAYRRGYYADDPNAPLRNGAQLSRQVSASGMQHNAPEAHQLAFAVRIVPVGKPLKGTPSRTSAVPGDSSKIEVQHYAIDYAVAGPQVHFELNGADRRALLDFMASAYAEDGTTLAETGLQTANSLKPAAYGDVLIGGFRLHQEVDIPTRAVSLRLGVVDETDAHLGTVELPLPLKAPPDVPRARIRSLPPIEPD